MNRPNTVLLIEDNSGDATLFRLALARTDPVIHLIWIPTAEAALRLIGDNAEYLDLIFVDMNLPLMSGTEFLEALEAFKPARPIPAIVLTGAEPTAAMKASLTRVSVSYIVKPLTLAGYNDLAERASAWCRNVEATTIPAVVNG